MTQLSDATACAVKPIFNIKIDDVLAFERIEAFDVESANLTVALRYAAAGIAVFPCNELKKPLVKWRDASTTRTDTLRFWWRTWPDSIVGIDLAKTGLIVVDADRHDPAKDGVAALATLESDNEPFDAHPIIRTPRNGYHHIFKQPAEPLGNSTGALPDGIDIRGDGGYVVAAGCTTDAGAWVADDDAPDLVESYKADVVPVLPDWFAGIVRTPKVQDLVAAVVPTAPEAPPAASHLPGTRERAYAESALDGNCSELAALSEGSRNTTLNAIAYRMGRMVARHWIAQAVVESRLYRAADACGLLRSDGHKQVTATIRSGLKGGMADPHPDLEEDDFSTFADTDDDTLPAGFIMDDGAELPEPDDLIKGLVPKGDVMFIGGQSGAGKSALAIHMAYCLASGVTFFGRRIKECVGVAVLAAEGAGASYQRRLRVARTHMPIAGNKDFAVAYLGSVPDLANDKELAGLVPRLRQLDRYFRKAYGVRLGVIIIDTVAAAFNLDDEDDNSEASKTIKRMKHLGQQVGALVVPVHHYGKASTTGLRGASGWKAGCDAILSVLADIDQLTGAVKHRELALAKSRDGEAGPVAPFDLVFVELGTDSDGDAFGSIYVEPRLDKASQIAATVPVARESEYLTVFRQAFTDCACIPYLVRGVGPAVQAVRLAEVRAEFVKRWVTGETDAEKRASAIRTAFSRGKRYAREKDFGFETAGDGTEWVWFAARARQRDRRDKA
jgi:hypothetical protein